MTALPILCVSLEEAKTMLAGKDPRDFGVQPVSGSGRGMVFYIPAIRQRLDELAGIVRSDSPAGGENDNDEEADFADIDAAIGFPGDA
ncbi:hypothetical protein [uncultured Hyphomonas sp.]|uniref:hypothetical protein n=1 Tax=uncultured Hyphomonas sp. TaxID=225298 RepID=UPI000C43A878|nr:hypothetical protein [Hyphomonadaceae bacterium]MBA30138.1 hypothetical protein [Hyphomonadaceae bacterium]QDP63674.1 MAG: hypothetical protein GOVbin258_2 [Prokaryotic dsDNA virus sp.]|tara:strand:+ start:47233 stop:47496 length:264 start_codon:yes stop_codon:yes gene_type:complete